MHHQNTNVEKETEDAITTSAFAKKLYNIVNNPLNSSIIGWNKSGDHFIIYNPNEFAEKILSGDEFTSSNYASFVRQLNMYDFHKIKNRLKDKSDTFCNKYFLRDRPSLLRNIKRKSANNQIEDIQAQHQIQVCPKTYLPTYKATETTDTQYKKEDQSKDANSKNNSRINKNLLSSLYTNFLKNIHLGKKKQDDIESKLDNLYRQNLELISQNKTLLSEISNKTEYTKTLEQLFMFILEFFMKKNENNQHTRGQDYFNNINEKVKDLIFNQNLKDNKENEFLNNITQNPNKTSTNLAFPMIADSSKYHQSPHSSPNPFKLNNIPSPGIDNLHYSNFDLFESIDKNAFTRKNSISSNLKLSSNDYMNVTNSPQTNKTSKDSIKDSDFFDMA